MKLKFEAPELKIIPLLAEDIIQTSGEFDGGGENETPPWVPSAANLDSKY